MIAEAGPWKISVQYKICGGEKVKSELNSIHHKDSYAGYYERKPGYPIFIVRRPHRLSEDQQDELAHLVRAIDERDEVTEERVIVFIKGISPSHDETIRTPKQSRIILPEA